MVRGDAGAPSLRFSGTEEVLLKAAADRPGEHTTGPGGRRIRCVGRVKLPTDIPSDNRKAALLCREVTHIDITSFDARPIVSAMEKMSFSSRDLGRATEIYNNMLADKSCTIMLTLASIPVELIDVATKW